MSNQSYHSPSTVRSILDVADKSIREGLSQMPPDMSPTQGLSAVLACWVALAIQGAGQDAADGMLSGALAGLRSDYPGKKP